MLQHEYNLIETIIAGNVWEEGSRLMRGIVFMLTDPNIFSSKACMTAKETLLKIGEECFTNFHSIIDNESPTFPASFVTHKTKYQQ